jgi:hypothetical protein
MIFSQIVEYERDNIISYYINGTIAINIHVMPGLINVYVNTTLKASNGLLHVTSIYPNNDPSSEIEIIQTLKQHYAGNKKGDRLIKLGDTEIEIRDNKVYYKGILCEKGS